MGEKASAAQSQQYLSTEKTSLQTIRVKLRASIHVQFSQIIPSCHQGGAVILFEPNTFLGLESSRGKSQVKNEQDFVPPLALVNEDVFQNQWSCNNGNFDVDLLFEFSDDSIFCRFSELNTTAKRPHTLETPLSVVNFKS